ncbi:hypothetical protein BC936DRAFT_141438 [Jimgerdemannia flammicorona]|uniref:Uncharacterized protein n=1 Tax=Jimgerdemannia flammicorona TaxID=994334 RepID=A0A433A289_9FUNG|nr:hypothetical protein BC936DRAFT_141438 [Jimgerdemannia flammicorona]
MDLGTVELHGIIVRCKSYSHDNYFGCDCSLIKQRDLITEILHPWLLSDPSAICRCAAGQQRRDEFLYIRHRDRSDHPRDFSAAWSRLVLSLLSNMACENVNA